MFCVNFFKIRPNPSHFGDDELAPSTMNTLSTKDLSAFGQAAVALDADFSELERLSVQLSKVEIETDSGLEQSRKLLGRFGECGQRIGEQMQVFAKSLEESRDRAEKASHEVAARAALIQDRQRNVSAMLQRFEALGEMVKQVTLVVAQLRAPTDGELATETREAIMAKIPDLDGQIELRVLSPWSCQVLPRVT